MRPNILEGKCPHSGEDLAKFSDKGDNEEDTSNVNVSTVQLGKSDQVTPSELLGCPLWRANTLRLFELHKKNDDLRIDPVADVS